MKRKTILELGTILGVGSAILFAFRPRHEKLIAPRPVDLVEGELYEVTVYVTSGEDKVKIKIVDRKNNELWAFDSNEDLLKDFAMKPFRNNYILYGRFIYDSKDIIEEGVLRVECRTTEMFSLKERIPKITLIL